MTDDFSTDALRRQLRFSLFLQAFAALMLGVALVVRVATSGLDVVTVLLVVAVLVVVGAAAFTISRLRMLDRSG